MKHSTRVGKLIHAPAQGQTIAEAIADGVITAKIRSRLMADSRTNGYSIRVATIRAMVRLDGYVESADVRHQVLRIAWDVSGVRQVDDFLDVRNSKSSPLVGNPVDLSRRSPPVADPIR